MVHVLTIGHTVCILSMQDEDEHMVNKEGRAGNVHRPQGRRPAVGGIRYEQLR